jgi:hypothetical protein
MCRVARRVSAVSGDLGARVYSDYLYNVLGLPSK